MRQGVGNFLAIHGCADSMWGQVLAKGDCNLLWFGVLVGFLVGGFVGIGDHEFPILSFFVGGLLSFPYGESWLSFISDCL